MGEGPSGRPMSKKIYTFEELSEKAQIKAVEDYIEGWEETHEPGDMTWFEALSALRDDYPVDNLDNYEKDGTWIDLGY